MLETASSLPVLRPPQDPEMKVYTELHLNAGLKYFINKDTWNGIRGLDQDLMKDALKR